MTPLLARRMRLVDKTTDCWTWTGHRSRTGYGQTSDRHRTVSAHRWFYEQLVGPIPEGLNLDHLCRNRACIRPDHLEPVTTAENLRRGAGVNGVNAAKTHCKQGHPLTGDNVRVTGPRRVCRACSRAWSLAYWRRTHA